MTIKMTLTMTDQQKRDACEQIKREHVLIAACEARIDVIVAQCERAGMTTREIVEMLKRA